VPLYELDWFLEALTALDALSLRLGTFREHPDVWMRRSLSDLADLWQQRLQERVPVQYLVGTTPWRDFSITVTPAVLIPRPETELIIDWVKTAVDRTPTLQRGHWADLGTGSGAIALGLAEVLPQAMIHAVDQSADAVAVAQENAQHNGMGDRIQFYIGSWFEPLAALRRQLSGMVSNPPYIPTPTVQTLQPEVTRHEPHAALDGGADGLDSLRHLVNNAPTYLISGGFWIVELMDGQAPVVANLLAQHGQYNNVQIHQDLAGIERFVSGDRI
jgi:release factor glutamine methyltransferase